MNTLKIGDLVLGKGMPKICIPLTGFSQNEILKEAELTETLPCQLVEWRADYMLSKMKEETPQRQGEKLKQVLGYLRIALDVPIIFTIRTEKEGGMVKMDKEDYFKINELIAEGGMADFMDIETFDAPGQVDEERIRDFIFYAHKNGSRVLLSNHDFEKTPDLEEMLARFFVMQELGADMMKLAVMPESESDVFSLLEVAALMRDTYAEIPFIALSMGELGATTRICGGEFGSVITFAAGQKVSAPGQLDANALHEFLVQYY
ncbi:type I 3-dehydroquinate dehydratase [Eubacteriales bacterium DFI.9.88]|nr:type I 3-dehydroquinate dehydratase [Eubacteriales bacterium DFI.9.88]